jgi:hypothetical protein
MAKTWKMVNLQGNRNLQSKAIALVRMNPMGSQSRESKIHSQQKAQCRCKMTLEKYENVIQTNLQSKTQ